MLDTLESLLIGTAVLDASAVNAVGYSVSAERFPVLHDALASDTLDVAVRLEIAVRALLRGWVAGATTFEGNGRRPRKAAAPRARATAAAK